MLPGSLLFVWRERAKVLQLSYEGTSGQVSKALNHSARSQDSREEYEIPVIEAQVRLGPESTNAFLLDIRSDLTIASRELEDFS